MNTKSLLSDARADRLPETLGIRTACGIQRFQELFSQPLETKIEKLQERQQVLFSYKHQSAEKLQRNANCFETVKQIEPLLTSVRKPTSLEKESVEQILFTNTYHLQVLNTLPFLLMVVSLWKQYVVPVLAVTLPLLFFILPFLTMKVLYKLPITFKEYTKIFCVTLGIPMDSGKLDWKQSGQLLFTAISMGQSIYQPIQTSYHIQNIEKDIYKKADALLELKRVFLELYPEKASFVQDFESQDRYRTFAEGWDLPFRVEVVLWMIGDMEVIHSIATHKYVRPTRFNTRGYVSMKSLIDPLLENSKPNSFFFTPKRHHSLLTGPNGGGKSTALRCILLNIIFSQRMGVCFTTEKGSATLHPFDWIQSGLHLEDTPGKLSMFEREVQFAAEALQRQRANPTKRGLLLFDELFHSTNPPDGERTARAFLSQVWEQSTLSSIISTHVFSLAESSADQIQKLCVPAESLPDGKLRFSYTLQPGICKVSSVDLVLQRCGFFPPGKPGGEKE
jgi:hypothetical protein